MEANLLLNWQKILHCFNKSNPTCVMKLRHVECKRLYYKFYDENATLNLGMRDFIIC